MRRTAWGKRASRLARQKAYPRPEYIGTVIKKLLMYEYSLATRMQLPGCIRTSFEPFYLSPGIQRQNHLCQAVLQLQRYNY